MKVKERDLFQIKTSRALSASENKKYKTSQGNLL